MNNEELKNRVIEILDNNIRWQPYYYISRGIVYEDDLGKIADALISAGIGDVKEAEKEYRDAIFLAVTSQTMTSERSRYIELNKNIAEHRAEVAERALREACSRAWSIECTCPSIFEDNDECFECYKNQSEKRYEEKDAIDCLSKKLLEQAEKELAEEGKDENY